MIDLEFDTKREAEALQFFQSSELRESQQQAGVLGRPEVYEEVAFFPI